MANLYQSIFKPFLFRLDPEKAHELGLGAAQLAQNCGLRQLLAMQFSCQSPQLELDFAGIHWRNFLGLAAGLDKNAIAIPLFDALGFGSIEIGTVTPLPQSGNPKPRIFRFPNDQALINRMGFPSEGVEAVAARLQKLNRAQVKARLGINIGKNKATALENAAADYLICFRRLYEFADYFVLNISSPNTPELRKLQEKARLQQLLNEIQSANSKQKAVMVKLAPDLNTQELEEVLEVCLESKIRAVIATNTTLSRDGLSQSTNETGGLSGKPLFGKSLAFVRQINQLTSGKLPIIGVGGISSAENVSQMLAAGAGMVQIYSALIYQGPGLIKKILLQLSKNSH